MPTDPKSPYLPFGDNTHAPWYGKDILSVKQFNRADLEYIFGVAHEMRGMVERVGTFDLLKGKILANLFYRDVKYLVTVMLQLWMFLTNVIYPLPTNDPLVKALINANPMTPIIASYRRGLIDGLAPEPGPFLAAMLISLFVLLTGWRLFRGTEHRFAECI